MAQELKTVGVKIEGRVQGVYYRAWTEQAARDLGLDGWVRNCRDGTVQAVFSGEPARVDDMVRRCAEGPLDARVNHVDVTDLGGAPPSGFQILPTA